MDRIAIIARARKLRRLAESAKKMGSHAEAEAAWRQAERLRKKYHLTDVEMSDSSADATSDEEIVFCEGVEARARWREALVLSILVHAGARGSRRFDRDGNTVRLYAVNDGQAQRARAVYASVERALIDTKRSDAYKEGAAVGAGRALGEIRARRPKGTAIIPVRRAPAPPDAGGSSSGAARAPGNFVAPGVQIHRRPGYGGQPIPFVGPSSSSSGASSFGPANVIYTDEDPYLAEIDRAEGMYIGRQLAETIDRLLFPPPAPSPPATGRGRAPRARRKS